MEANTTSTTTLKTAHSPNHGMTRDTYDSNFALYIGIGVAVGIAICVIIIVVLVRHGRFKYLRNRSWSCVSTKKILIRGFSTVSQRGMMDSTAEFEMVNTSVSSDVEKEPNIYKNTPRKPGRRKRSSSATNKYENVMLDPTAGFIVRKSVSMSSDIPYIDHTIDKTLKEEDDDDEVFT